MYTCHTERVDLVSEHGSFVWIAKAQILAKVYCINGTYKVNMQYAMYIHVLLIWIAYIQ